MIDSVCVFCGSNAGHDSVHRVAAAMFATECVQQGLRIVYGGARIGLMGVIADTALTQQGEVIGVMPSVLIDKELAHTHLTSLEIVDSMQARKQRMTELSDAFVILPGGLGSMDELFEVWTWIQVGIHDKPIGLLNVAGYYDALITFLDKTVSEGFVSEQLRQRLFIDNDSARLLHKLQSFQSDGSAAKYRLTEDQAQ